MDTRKNQLLIDLAKNRQKVASLKIQLKNNGLADYDKLAINRNIQKLRVSQKSLEFMIDNECPKMPKNDSTELSEFRRECRRFYNEKEAERIRARELRVSELRKLGYKVDGMGL
jgi:hypothetical protein